MPSERSAPSSSDRTAASGGLTRRPSWGAILGLVVFGAGFLLGARPLRDNSFLTHLATGRVILATGSVPGHDPYTATATGEPWVVQSWLVSVLYATAEALGGLDLVRVVAALMTGTVAIIAWRLLRPVDSLVARLALIALFFVVCAQSWAERPLMVGLICLGIVALAAEEGWDPRWLVPLGWIWANSHGSHPLGIAYLVVLIVGTHLDGADSRSERRALGWLALGIVLGVVGPLGLRVLLFPVELLSRRDVLSGVVEWRAPTFESVGQQAFLAFLALAIVLLVRKASFRHGLVLAVFGVAAVMSLRNLPVAALVLLPGMAAAVPELGALRTSSRPRIARPAMALAAVGLLLGGGVRLQMEPLALHAYPVDALARWHQEGRPGLLVTKEVVDNLQTFVYGPAASSFYDDRFDMFPDELTSQYRVIASGGSRVRTTLAELDVDAVLWERSSPIVGVLVADPDWHPVHLDERWALLCRRGSGIIESC